MDIKPSAGKTCELIQAIDIYFIPIKDIFINVYNLDNQQANSVAWNGPNLSVLINILEKCNIILFQQWVTK